jgi:SAM-dependent methyltransferase
MENFKSKVNASSSFYNNSFLNFDYKLNEFNYKTFKPFFKGKVACELGPALGQMTRFLVNDFEKIHLIEGSNELLSQIPDYPNAIKHNFFFEEFITEKKFDTIIMSHVLEHIEYPVSVLKRVYDWLDDNGVFLLSVPNARSIHRLVAVEMGLLDSIYQLNQRDMELGHYRIYDIESLKMDAQKAGFNVIDEGGIFFKPISNKQIDDYWTEEMIYGFFKLSKLFPHNCAEIYLVCTK